MNRIRLVTLLLTLALALAAAPAVVADSHEGESFDPATVEEFNQDEALIVYQALANRLLAMGVAAEDVDDALAYLKETYASLSEDERAALAEGEMAEAEETARERIERERDEREEERERERDEREEERARERDEREEERERARDEREREREERERG